MNYGTMQVLDLDLILKNPDIVASIKLLTTRVKQGMWPAYAKPGKFFQELSKFDRQQLIDISYEATSTSPEIEYDPATMNIVALTSVLSTVEGFAQDNQSLDSFSKSFAFMNMLLTCLSLEDKGAVKVIYDNISFDPSNEEGEKPIVERLF